MEINHRFVHLRARSSYSLAQGAILIDTLISLAKRENMPALALTDEGNLFGTLEFALKASEKGIQPIIGCILELEMPDKKENHKFNYKKNISNHNPESSGISQYVTPVIKNIICGWEKVIF